MTDTIGMWIFFALGFGVLLFIKPILAFILGV